jgi:hypothetical protein
MQNHHGSSRRLFFGLGFGVLWVFATGCTAGYHNEPVDASKARETLETALESWKNGNPSDALQSLSPPIYVIDIEWKGGAKLKDYKIGDDDDEKDAHLFCPVTLTLESEGKKEVKKQVIYIISTAPNLTVARKVF